MPCYVAFLRAINVGGHTVKMETLRQLFVSFGFSGVETFIASGNVIFQSASQDTTALEEQIACGVEQALGYEVATFIRSPVELREISAYRAFPQVQVQAATSNNIAFLHGPLDEQAKQKLMGLRTEIDSFATHGGEVYWLCRKRQSESTFSNAALEKTLGVRSTLRGVATVQKLAERVG